jgi:hypothetical protein
MALKNTSGKEWAFAGLDLLLISLLESKFLSLRFGEALGKFHTKRGFIP